MHRRDDRCNRRGAPLLTGMATLLHERASLFNADDHAHNLVAIDHCQRPSAITLGDCAQTTRHRRSRKGRLPAAGFCGSSWMSLVGAASACSWLASAGMGNWSASEPMRRRAAAAPP